MLRLLVAAGGTGGGVYPALAVVGALVASHKDSDVLWVGGEGGMEASLVARAGIEFRSIPAAGLHGVGLSAIPGNLTRLALGAREARDILRQFDPDVLFFTGGYVGVPVAYAGRKSPQMMFVPDIEPALALRWISRWVDAITVTSDESIPYNSDPEKVTVTGYPTRAMLKPIEKGEARRRLGLSESTPAILVFGGSRGARSINHALWANLEDFLNQTQVIHITGELDWQKVEGVLGGLRADISERYRPYAYVHDEMNEIFSAIDIVVSRAGAAVLGEYPLFGLPAVLVPYPHAWRYQWVNAQYLEQRDAAIVLRDERLGQDLLPAVLDLLRDQASLNRMAAAMRHIHRPDAADQIAGLLVELANRTEGWSG